MATIDLSRGRDRLEDRVRSATAGLRGAALAIATTAAAVREQLERGNDCPDGDQACLDEAYADLLRHRHRITLATREIARLEQTPVEYEGRVPSGAPQMGWHVPSVTAARRMVDNAHDVVAEALLVARAAAARLDEGAARSVHAVANDG